MYVKSSSPCTYIKPLVYMDIRNINVHKYYTKSTLLKVTIDSLADASMKMSMLMHPRAICVKNGLLKQRYLT